MWSLPRITYKLYDSYVLFVQHKKSLSIRFQSISLNTINQIIKSNQSIVTIPSLFPWSWPVTGYLEWLTRHVPLVGQDLLIRLNHMFPHSISNEFLLRDLWFPVYCFFPLLFLIKYCVFCFEWLLLLHLSHLQVFRLRNYNIIGTSIHTN